MDEQHRKKQNGVCDVDMPSVKRNQLSTAKSGRCHRTPSAGYVSRAFSQFSMEKHEKKLFVPHGSWIRCWYHFISFSVRKMLFWAFARAK